jgi:molybdate transport system substrate-binding protein
MLGRSAAFAMVWLLAAQGPARPEPITVSAAVSLSDVLEEIANSYTRAGGGPIRFNFAASNVLARQIVNGGRVDLFISADELQMDVVEKAGVLQAGSRVPLVANRLAVVAPPDRVQFVKDHFTRAPPEIRRLALGDPAAVPAGIYARQYLEKQGLWASYASRVVPTTSVRAALAAVETGSVDAAIVYATDVPVAKRAALAFIVPNEQAPRIVYPAALVSSAPAARKFLAFLRESPEARAIFERYQFLSPAAR